MSEVRVLVLEEQTLFRKTLCHALERDARFKIVEDYRAPHGISGVVPAKPDVVLLDVDFHRGDPIDTAKTIKAACAEARVCLIALEPRTELLSRGLSTGAIDGFVLKDIGTWDLSSALVSLAQGQSHVDARVAGKMLIGIRDAKRPNGVSDLSERERDVVRLIALGLSNKEISAKLTLSEKTIKNHISRIFSKLNVTARTQAAIHAIKHGIA